MEGTVNVQILTFFFEFVTQNYPLGKRKMPHSQMMTKLPSAQPIIYFEQRSTIGARRHHWHH